VIAIHRVRMKPKPKIRIGRLRYAPGKPAMRIGHVRVEHPAQQPPGAERKAWPRE
jgi:hypothetical protein